MKNKIFIILTALCIILAVIAFPLIITFVRKNTIPDKNMKITMVLKTTDPNIYFWQVVKAGAETAKEEYGISLNFIGPAYENDIDYQISAVESLVFQKPSIVILASCDYNRLVPAVQKLHSKGIPVITLDSGINSTIPESFIATDNIKAGEKAGRKMAELLRTGDPIAIISYVKVTSTAMEREQGVRNEIEKSGKIKIDSVYYTDNFTDKATEITLELMKNKPYLKGIIALNEPTTTGVARALKKINQGDNKTVLVGFDSSIEEIEFLEEGIIHALVVQKPFNMGYLGIKTAIDYLKGIKVRKWIDTDSSLITLNNLYSEENQKLLFPLIKENPSK
jgi:ribose transport system substrate-binding protein